MSHSTRPDQPQHQYYDDEIDLRELVMKLWQRKLWILATTFVAALFTWVYLATTTPIYRVSVQLNAPVAEQLLSFQGSTLPNLTNDGLIDRVLFVFQNSEVSAVVLDKLSTNYTAPVVSVPDVSVDTRQYTLSIDYSDAEFAAEYLNELAVFVLEHAVSDFINEMETYRSAEIERLTGIVNTIRKDQGMLADINHSDLLLPYISALYEQKSIQPELIVKDLGSIETKAEPTTRPIKPKKSLILALGVVLGLMLGLFIALVIPVKREGK